MKVYINRKIEREEQTLDDGSITRIERGRKLKCAYYTKAGIAINFSIELEAAVSGIVSAVGLTLASTAALLAF